MTSQAYDAAARDAAQIAAHVAQLGRGLSALSARTTASIGGTATAEDRAMIALLGNVTQRLDWAARDFDAAAQAARRAAREAADAEGQQARQRNLGRR